MEVIRTDAEKAILTQSETPVLSGPSWLSDLQSTARSEFETLGLPHRRVEEWKYTDLRSALKVAYAPAAGNVVSGAEIDQLLGVELAGLDSYRMVFVDGALDEALSNYADCAGLEALSLKAALENDVSWVKKIGTLQQSGRDAVQALNLLMMQGGAAIRIEEKAEIAKPLQLIYVTSAEGPSSVASRLFFEIGAASKIEIIETHFSLHGQSSQINVVAELNVGDFANVRHVKITSDRSDSIHLANVIGRLGKETDYGLFQVTLDGGITRNQVEMRYDGDNAKADISGVALLDGKSHSDLTLVMDHAALGCESRELFKTVLDGEGRAVFQGKVIVQPGAQKTDGSMMSKALLLSDSAEFDSKPELEIYADDVLCGHGATTGQIDDELLFYLKARGISDKEARALLIQAFVGEALELIENDVVRELLIERTVAWYEKD